MMRSFLAIIVVCVVAISAMADNATRRRRTTPVETPATATQSVNATAGDTARINAARRAASTHYHRDDGAIVYVDTVTGEQWVDSATIASVPRMEYPLYVATTVGVNIWDPVMRLFGQKHGIIGFSADVNLHNRYFPGIEVGLGTASNTPAGENFSYHSPMSVYFKIGADYNFLYNSNPAYQWLVGLRYGFAPFSWSVSDVSMSPGYWDEPVRFDIPSQRSTAGWIEVCMGLRVKLIGNLSAGWMVRFHSLLHESHNVHGEPWYIPGYGSRNGAITGSFSLFYTLPASLHKHKVDGGDEAAESR